MVKITLDEFERRIEGFTQLLDSAAAGRPLVSPVQCRKCGKADNADWAGAIKGKELPVCCGEIMRPKNRGPDYDGGFQ